MGFKYETNKDKILEIWREYIVLSLQVSPALGWREFQVRLFTRNK